MIQQFHETFQRRYHDACLSKFEFPEEEMHKLNHFLKNGKNILFLSSNPGTGKTYLLAALVKMLIEKKKYYRFFEERKLFSALRSVMDTNTDWEYQLKMFCEVDWFLLDDFASCDLDKYPWRKDILFSMVDHRYANGLPTIITSNETISSLREKLHPRLISRLTSKENTIIEINMPDKRQ